MRQWMGIGLLAACILCLNLPASFAVELSDQKPALTLDREPLDAWLEPGGLTAEWVARSKSPELRSSTFHYRRDPVWVRVPIWNRSSRADWRVYIHPRTLQRVEMSLFDEAFSLRQQGLYRIGRAGEAGSLDSITPGFSLEIPPGERRLLVLRLQAYEQLGLDIRFELPDAGIKQVQKLDLALGIYMGVLAALLIYTALIYRTLREDFFRPYLLFIGSMLVLVPTLNGGPDYLFELPFHFTDLIAVATALTCLAGNEFSRQFLRLRVHSPRLGRFQAGFSMVCAGAAVLALPPFYHSIPAVVGPVNDVLLVCTVLLIVTAGVVAIRAGVKSAWIFMSAWLGFLASCLIFLLSTHGIIPNNLFTRSAVEIGNTLEMLILAVAISDRVRELEVERLAALKRALHADRLQSLVKMICHDLTSPLSVVSTHAEMARSGRPASWDAVRRAVQEQDRIVSFVRSHDSILDVPHLEAVSAVIPVQLGEVMATLKFLFEGRARTKGVELRMEGGADGVSIWGEEATLVHSVLGNALSNAIKFSNRGSAVRVLVACEQEWVEICVEDQGVGMPQALQERIRAASKGVNRPGTQGEPGTGYGLGLMRYFTEAYGGSLSWTSRSREDGFEQTGTRLVFRFRRALAGDLPQGSKSGTLGA